MLKRTMWLSAAAILITGAFVQPVYAAKKPAPHAAKAAAKKPAEKKPAAPAATEESSSEAGLDLTLRTSAAAMPVVTADGSTLETPASHVYLMDYDTGTVLASKASDNKMYPSSMTKMMTLYLIFEHLKDGTLTLGSQFTVSEKTWTNWNNKGSSMFLPINSQVSLEELIRGIAIQSGNDACVVAAEGLAGSEESFSKMMNEKAKTLGMQNTNFTDSTGWPDPNHTTTPHDLALLGTALVRDFPQYYHYLSEREFSFHNIRQYNRNLLLNNTALGVDGIKTGHTDAAGYGITLAAKQPGTGRRLILVVNGLGSETERASEGERLLTWGFSSFENKVLFKAGAPIVNAPVWMGREKEVALTVASDVISTIPKLGRDKIKITATMNTPIAAPAAAGTEYGKLAITMPNGTTQEVPLVAATQVEKLNIFARIPRLLGL